VTQEEGKDKLLLFKNLEKCPPTEPSFPNPHKILQFCIYYGLYRHFCQKLEGLMKEPQLAFLNLHFSLRLHRHESS